MADTSEDVAPALSRAEEAPWEKGARSSARLSGLERCGCRSDLDGEADIVKSSDQVSGQLGSVPGIKVVGAEVVVVDLMLEQLCWAIPEFDRRRV